MIMSLHLPCGNLSFANSPFLRLQQATAILQSVPSGRGIASQVTVCFSSCVLGGSGGKEVVVVVRVHRIFVSAKVLKHDRYDPG